jgi:peptidoglycan/xylan/chitin deacetylase (PgdA/CDA1 family)
MIEPFEDDHAYLTELPEDLRLKRAAAARRRRWRRRMALGALMAAAGAVVALAVTSLGGGSKTAPREARHAEGAGGSRQAGPAYPADWKPHPGPVPIVDYHAIQPPPEGSSDPQAFVPQADFERQMEWLDEHGYEAVTLDQVEDAWYEGGKLAPKPIVVSFDDGYVSQYVGGFPKMEELGWSGVLNLLASESDLPDSDVRKMIEAGWELASHSITHPDLTTLDAARLEREVAGSRRILSRRFDVRVDNFCYPSGRYDDTVISAVHRAGYRGAQTEIPGLADAAHPYILERIEIELDDGLSGFTEKLKAAESGSPATTTTTTTSAYSTTTPTTTTTTTTYPTTTTTTSAPATTSTTARTNGHHQGGEAGEGR